ncbi:hypothetical protein H8356DRAFT_1655890, partial [Neocallimastix lanati (nom. inval.)]
LFIKYNEKKFAYGIFYIVPIFGYKVFIIRVYAPEINKLKKNASKYNNNIRVTPKIFHCDFEKGISNVVIKIY